MDSKLLAATQPGMTMQVVPLSPQREGAATIQLPPGVQSLVGEGANFAVLQTDGATVFRKLGPASLTNEPPYHNGVKGNPDLRLVRALAVECYSTAPAGPAPWAGDPEASLTLGYLADAGQPGATQTAAAALLTAWDPDAVVTVGDFSHNVATGAGTALNADLAAFNALISSSRLLPVMGDREWNAANIMALLDAKFPYITSFPGTAYHDLLIPDAEGEPFAHIICLDGGRNTAGTAIGAGLTGGAGPGSTQWSWMLGRIAHADNYGARWRIACVHWPMTTGVQSPAIMPELVALARSGHFDLILCGHTEGNEEMVIHGVPVLNISTASRPVRPSIEPLRGALGDAQVSWRDDTRQCITRLSLTPHALTWQVHDLADGAVVRVRGVAPRAPRPVGAFEVFLQDGVTGVSQDVKANLSVQAGDSILLQWPQGLPFTGSAALVRVGSNLNARHTALRAFVVGF